MSFLMELLVALAASAYLFSQALRLKDYLEFRTMERQMREYDQLHTNATESIEGSFELWWNETRAGLIERSLENAADDFFLPELLDDASLVNDLIRPQLEVAVDTQFKHRARHIALHANMAEAQTALMRRSSKRSREFLKTHLKEHDEALNADRKVLLAGGIDTESLEAHFSA